MRLFFLNTVTLEIGVTYRAGEFYVIEDAELVADLLVCGDACEEADVEARLAERAESAAAVPAPTVEPVQVGKDKSVMLPAHSVTPVAAASAPSEGKMYAAHNVGEDAPEIGPRG